MIKDNVVNERKILIKCTKIVIIMPVAVKDIFLDMDSVLSSLLKKVEDKCANRILEPSCNNWHIHSLFFALLQKIAMHCPRKKLFLCLHQFCYRELLLFFG